MAIIATKLDAATSKRAREAAIVQTKAELVEDFAQAYVDSKLADGFYDLVRVLADNIVRSVPSNVDRVEPSRDNTSNAQMLEDAKEYGDAFRHSLVFEHLDDSTGTWMATAVYDNCLKKFKWSNNAFRSAVHYDGSKFPLHKCPTFVYEAYNEFRLIHRTLS